MYHFYDRVKLIGEKPLETAYNFINGKAERHVSEGRVD